MSSQRIRRLSDQVQRELADLIRYNVKDPRLSGMITVVAVKLSSDIGYADVYVTVIATGTLHTSTETETLELNTIEILNHAAPFLRQELGRRMKTRTVPRLRFHYDRITANANYMNALINQAVADLPTPLSDSEEAPQPIL